MKKSPGIVELNSVECCALARGFAKNPKVIAQLMDLIDKKKLKLFADELVRTERLAFIPTDEMKTAYYQIAKAELAGLESEPSPTPWA